MANSALLSLVGTLAFGGLIGYSIAWLLCARRLRLLDKTSHRLRNDRRDLAKKLRSRELELRDASNAVNQAESLQELLQTRYDALEAEQACLVVDYNNLQRLGVPPPVDTGTTNDWFADNGESVSDPELVSHELPDSTPGTDDADRSTAIDIPTLHGSDSDAISDTVPAQEWPDSAPDLSDTQIDRRAQALADLAVFEEQLASAQNDLAIERNRELDETVLTPNTAEAEPVAPVEQTLDSIRDDEALAVSAFEVTIAEQDAEITRLQDQLAPLLGLPLTVSTREAERDRLAQRLDATDKERHELRNQVAQLTRNQRALQRQIDDQNSQQNSASLAHTDASAKHATTVSEPLQSKKPKRKKKELRRQLEKEALRRAADVATQTPDVSSRRIPRQYDGAPGRIDNLKQIRGIGPVLERKLNRLGVFQFAQIASWSPEDIAFFNEQMSDFRGRIERDEWVDGARRIVADD